MRLLMVTQTFRSDIRMKFGVDICASMHVVRGSVIRSDNICISDSVFFRTLGEEKTYKYLETSEALGINEQNIKPLVKERFFGCL